MIKSKTYISDLNDLYAELERVECMDETEVMAAYNADSKEEIRELIREEIESLERGTMRYGCCYHLPGDDPDDDRHADPDEELEQERTGICLSQGLSRYC